MDLELYDRYGLLNLPRTFGFPTQLAIRSVKHLENLIDSNNGKVPIFISVNSHNDSYVNMSQFYSDFDGHGFYTLEDALKDVKKLAEYYESQHFDFLADFTGRGYRTLLKVTPDIVRISEIDGVLKGYSKYLKKSLDLKTMDLKVAEPKRIMRPPLTQYIYEDRTAGKTVITKRHTIPLNMEMLFDGDTHDHIYWSETMKYEVMPYNRRMPLAELYEYKEIQQYSAGHIAEDDIDFLSMPDDYFIEQLYDIYRDRNPFGNDLGPDEKLIKALLSVHPDHQTRLLGCIKAKESSYHLNLNSTLSLFAKLSLIAKWDNRNLDIQRKNIESVYRANYGIKHNLEVKK